MARPNLMEFVSIRALVLSLCALCMFAASAAAQKFTSVHDGVEYAELTREIAGKPVNMNMLRLDLTKVRLDVHHAMDAAIGTEKTSSIAMRQGAVAAINAGFFRLDNSIFAGDAAGLLVIDNVIYSESVSGRVALMLDNRGERTSAFIARANISNTITIMGKRFDAGTNRARGDNDLVVYTHAFHRTTLTGRDGLEVEVLNGRVRRVLDGRGSTVIPENGYIISTTGTKRDEVRRLVRVGTRIKMTGGYSSATDVSPGGTYASSEDVVGGVPQLIKNSKVDIRWAEEKSSRSFVETRHPRTAVAKLKDGKLLMITVDGRSEASGGIGLYDLANLLLDFGAVDAMNLDGGGSTTMFLDGKIVNRPSDKEGERKVSDAIVVTLRKKTKS